MILGSFLSIQRGLGSTFIVSLPSPPRLPVLVGTGTSCYQLGRNVKAAMQNTHLAAALEAGSVGGLLNQRVRKR